MEKSTKNKGKRDVKRAAFIKDTAALTGVSTSTVQKVLNSERNNETVEMVFQEIKSGYKSLLDQVKELVPFK